MSKKDIITMTSEELRRTSIIKRAIEKMITQKEAAKLIGLSYRQTKRIVVKVRQEGDTGVIHKSRGKPGHRRIDDEVKAKALGLYDKKYWDFGPTFASEKLYELDDIALSHETLRLWLIADSKREWQRKARPHRQWRQRKEHFGQMVQMDGSHHDWLEGRGPELVLMGCIDDATGKTFGRFYDYEGKMPALDSFKRYLKKYGLPQSIYLDNYSPYKARRKPTRAEELENKEPLTQFERALKELGVTVRHAHSPQAKGRIERAFRTLQDRLLKELRLAGIKSKNEANEFLKTYLPGHNKRFSIPPVKEADLHRKAPGQIELRRILCLKTERALRNDAVIRHNRKFYQIENVPRRRIKSVIVEDRLDGSMHVRNNGSYFKYREIDTPLIRRPVASEKPAPKIRKPYLPPRDHPWRRYKQSKQTLN